MKNIILTIFVTAIVFFSYHAQGQNTPNPIITAVPFLTIAPDARSGGLGDGGVAFSNDANVTYWNPARMVFLENNTNISLSYSPWYHETIPHSYLAYGAFVQRLPGKNAIGFSLKDLQLGTIPLYDENINSLGTFQPNEIAADVSIARQFSPTFSLALTARYIHSDIANNLVVQGVQTSSINSICSDVSLSYNSVPNVDDITVFSFGLDVSNLGPKVSYYAMGKKYFLPMNIRIGPAFRMAIGDKTDLLLACDINKLLVPTPPIRAANGTIIQGQDDNQSVVAGIFNSFSDAPGGFTEELQEIYGSGSVEIVFNSLLALRGGYFYENANKGNRQYATAGVGVKLSFFDVNLSYINAPITESPFANSLRLSMAFHW